MRKLSGSFFYGIAISAAVLWAPSLVLASGPCAPDSSRPEEHQNLDVSAQKMSEIVSILISRWGDLNPSHLKVESLSGGLTNRNLKIENPDGRAVVARVSGENSSLLGINRDDEAHNSEIAAQIGLGPEVVFYSPGNPLFITAFLKGKPLTAEAAKQVGTLKTVGTVLRKLHQGPSFQGHFSPFKTVRGYHQSALDHHIKEFPAQTEDALKNLKRIETALQHYLTSSSIHTDTLFGNILQDEKGRIRLIDWEYSALGDPYFDLGNYARAAELNPDQVEEFLTSYLGKKPNPAEIAHLELMRMAAYLREAFWCFLQSRTGSISFDYYAAGVEGLAEFTRRASQPEFETWLKLY